MKRIFAIGFLFTSLILSISATEGETVDSVKVSDFDYESNLDENLDSLENLWVVEESEQDEELLKASKDKIPEFSDSVYMDRLSRIPSVVDMSYNQVVKRYIEVYTKEKRDKVEVMLGLADYYFPMFDDIFDYYDVPNEMKYMAIIESALNPNAYSRARAVGLWQFMYSTGKMYGLTVNSLVDERRDPIKSTHAAARFSKDLYDRFGDWILVIAAYNCGPGNVSKAIRRAGGKTNYWDIYYHLPRETRGHVPAFIAATYVMHYYKEHNLYAREIEFPLDVDTLMITEKVHFKQISEMLDIPMKLLQDMNPQYRANIIPGNEKPYALKIPSAYVGDFITFQDSIFEYKKDEYLDLDKLTLAPASYQHSTPSAPSGNYAKLYYTVKPGDNLGYISEWYGVGLSQVRYWNGISKNFIRAGQKLTIYVPKSQLARYENVNNMSFAEKQAMVGKGSSSNNTSASISTGSSSSNYEKYVVRNGDTLWEIAKRYPGVSQNDIMKLNNLSYNSKIHPGQVLKIKTN